MISVVPPSAPEPVEVTSHANTQKRADKAMSFVVDAMLRQFAALVFVRGRQPGSARVCRSSQDPGEALVPLLLEVYSEEEFVRAVLSVPEGKDVLTSAPAGCSYRALVEAVVDALNRRGAVPDLIRVVARERPRRFEEVQAVAASWGVRLRPP